jgi:cell shape-determining protein MreC
MINIINLLLVMDLTTKKFTITLPTLIGLLSAISTIIAGYWYFKNTIESIKASVVSANENYKELKTEIQVLREQLYEVAIMYNKNVHIENQSYSSKARRRTRVTDDFSDELNSTTARTLKIQKDTIDIHKMRMKTPIKLKKQEIIP